MRCDARTGSVFVLAVASAAGSGCSMFGHKAATESAAPANVRTVISGVPQRVGFLYRSAADCGSDHPPALLVRQQPQHGTVNFIFAEDYLHLAQGDALAACDQHKVQGELVNYTSAAGWVGSDSFSIEAVSPGKKSTVIEYTVYVRFSPKPGAATDEDEATQPVSPDQVVVP